VVCDLKYRFLLVFISIGFQGELFFTELLESVFDRSQSLFFILVHGIEILDELFLVVLDVVDIVQFVTLPSLSRKDGSFVVDQPFLHVAEGVLSLANLRQGKEACKLVSDGILI
jgi:hypothetical protein